VSIANKKMTEVVEKYKIERTPSTLILNEAGKCQLALMGCTFQDIEEILKVKDRVAQGLPKGLQIVILRLLRVALRAKNL
jgi:predicted aconitase